MRAAVLGSDADLAWGACSQRRRLDERLLECPASSEELTSSSSLALSRSVDLIPKQTTGHSRSTGSVASGLFALCTNRRAVE